MALLSLRSFLTVVLLAGLYVPACQAVTTVRATLSISTGLTLLTAVGLSSGKLSKRKRLRPNSIAKDVSIRRPILHTADNDVTVRVLNRCTDDWTSKPQTSQQPSPMRRYYSTNDVIRR